jgi:succinate dehydrogenase / fumarate reductase cytochrome b subunit
VNFDMMTQVLKSSIAKKQIVAVTGLMLILFLIGHLAGNLYMYAGPEAFNAYAKKLASLRPGLLVVEIGLLAVFIIHLSVTALLVLENIKARGEIRYQVQKSRGNRSLATRLMPFTGTIILLFVGWHLLDFTFCDHHGPRSVLSDGKSYGLYGVVYNAFLDPIHSGLYILAMICIGFHLSHGVQSFLQTMGFHHPCYTPIVKKISTGTGILIALGYSSIPIYIMIKQAAW